MERRRSTPRADANSGAMMTTMKTAMNNGRAFRRLIPAAKRSAVENYLQLQIIHGVEYGDFLHTMLTYFTCSMQARYPEDDEWQQTYALFRFRCYYRGALDYIERRSSEIKAFQATNDADPCLEESPEIDR